MIKQHTSYLVILAGSEMVEDKCCKIRGCFTGFKLFCLGLQGLTPDGEDPETLIGHIGY